MSLSLEYSLSIAVVGTLMMTGCGQAGSKTYHSFDDCILKTVSRAPNSEAVEQLRSACARQFTIDEALELEVKASDHSDDEITITNPTNSIVVLTEIDAGNLGNWSYRGWIEPGAWVHVELSENPQKVASSADAGEVTAKSSRIIPIDGNEVND